MVLFTSNRPLERAENIKAIFDAYEGEKEFIQVDPYHLSPLLRSERYKLRVSDEFVKVSPGKTILIGHGIAGGKLVGVDQPHPFHNRLWSPLLTYVVTSSTSLIPVVARQSGTTEDRVLALGMPRTDSYFGKKKGDGGTFLAGKRAYLFCPTYRAVEETPMPYYDWDTVDQMLGDDEVLVVKPHMMTGQMLHRDYKHIVEVPGSVPSEAYLIDCDVLITDYSSIMFDAMLLGKPTVLFEKLPGYLETRGMYLKYPEGYTTRYAMNEYEVLKLCRSANGLNEAEIRCRDTVADMCDGHSCERLLRLIERTI